jgi:catechol 2,3-dioxygenase-like lactoylglutathione lyase family enzyme
MPEAIGIDHIYVTVSDLAAAEQFYDRVMIGVLAFRKNKFIVAGDFAVHDPYSPGLHHFCLRVDSEADVRAAANQLRALGIAATEPRLYPEYASDVWS